MGRNFDTLNDSIAAGQINQIELPYRLVIKNYDRIGAGAKQIASEFVDLINQIASRGFSVEVRTEISQSPSVASVVNGLSPVVQ